MQDEFRILAAAHTTSAAPLLPAPARRPAARPRAANEDSFQRTVQLRAYLRTARRHLAILAAFMAAVLLAGGWGGQASADGPLALSLLFAFGGCVPAGLAGVQLLEAHTVVGAFAKRLRDPFEAAAQVRFWREAAAFTLGAGLFAGLAYGLLG